MQPSAQRAQSNAQHGRRSRQPATALLLAQAAARPGVRHTWKRPCSMLREEASVAVSSAWTVCTSIEHACDSCQPEHAVLKRTWKRPCSMLREEASVAISSAWTACTSVSPHAGPSPEVARPQMRHRMPSCLCTTHTCLRGCSRLVQVCRSVMQARRCTRNRLTNRDEADICRTWTFEAADAPQDAQLSLHNASASEPLSWCAAGSRRVRLATEAALWGSPSPASARSASALHKTRGSSPAGHACAQPAPGEWDWHMQPICEYPTALHQHALRLPCTRQEAAHPQAVRVHSQLQESGAGI